MPIWALSAYSIGFILGYVAYDCTHYSLHHFSTKNEAVRSLQRGHMEHHDTIYPQEANFGVTSPLWDYVFGTHISHLK